MQPIVRSGEMAEAIDVMYHGRDRVICAYHLDGLVVDPGPTSSAAALDDLEPRALLLTHIHLDHAGAAGTLARRHPGSRVYVHERGAPHLVDPSRLISSASRLYGEEHMETLWGEIAPVPEERIVPLSGGEVVEGFRVAATPGHASHHVCYLHEETGDAYVGDMAGVRIPPYELTIAPTPPPDIDVEAWLSSLETIEAWDPSAVCVTHFGRFEDVAEQLDRVRSALGWQMEAARERDLERFEGDLRRWYAEELDPDTAESLIRAAPPDQLYLGLERYLTKRAEAGVS
jgi:glyoxylase-like metal-dependent hydrolase (beta-lactamase superfamily II)